MNDQIVFIQLAEIDLGAMTLGMIKPAARVRRETSVQFRGRQNDEVRCWKTKTACERAENKIDILQRVGADQFAEPLDFALGLKINDDAGFVVLPFLKPFDELVALGFSEKKIADRKLANIAIRKRAAEVFRTFFNPTFADLNSRFGFFLRLVVDRQIICADVIANAAALVVGRAEEDVDLAQVAD